MGINREDNPNLTIAGHKEKVIEFMFNGKIKSANDACITKVPPVQPSHEMF